MGTKHSPNQYHATHDHTSEHDHTNHAIYLQPDHTYHDPSSQNDRSSHEHSSKGYPTFFTSSSEPADTSDPQKNGGGKSLMLNTGAMMRAAVLPLVIGLYEHDLVDIFGGEDH